MKREKTTRTQKSIIAALLKLMETEHLDEITITQITQEAEIARRTFYLNYEGKKDVLHHVAFNLYLDYAELALSEENRSIRKDVFTFFSFCKDHGHILQLFEKNDQFILLLDDFEQLLAFSEEFRASKLFDINGTDPQTNSVYQPMILAAILWRLLRDWVQRDFKTPVHELTQVVSDMFSLSDKD